jgi:antitoxin component YwqK of YwqJK toxin-antitoxin module
MSEIVYNNEYFNQYIDIFIKIAELTPELWWKLCLVFKKIGQYSLKEHVQLLMKNKFKRKFNFTSGHFYILPNGTRYGECIEYLVKYFPSSSKANPFVGTYNKDNKMKKELTSIVYIKSNYKNNLLDGEYIRYYLGGDHGFLKGKGDGLIDRKCFFKNGLLEGEYIKYHNSKDSYCIRKRCFYKQGKLCGLFIQYYKFFQGVSIKCFYINGVKEGPYTEYSCINDENKEYGPVELETYYSSLEYKPSRKKGASNERMNGYYIRYYGGVGDRNIYSLCFYKNGKLEGSFTEYYSNGAVKIECFYKNGKKHGEYIKRFNFYNHNGIGNIQIKKYFQHGKLNGPYISYYKDGSIYRKCNYVAKIGENGNFKDGKIEGLCILYYNNETKTQESFYENNTKYLKN